MQFPDWLEPMKATLTAARSGGPGWTFERKLDGIRMLAYKKGSRVGLWSRDRLPLTDAYPAVAARLEPLRQATPPFTKAIGRLRVHWVRPEIVVQVASTEWTKYDKLRHPRLLGLRDDKAPREVVRERP